MSQRRLFRGPRCEAANCKSRLYYVSDGLTYCQNNHQKSGEIEYQIDEDEAMASGFGSRRKRGPDRDQNDTQKDSLVYHGKIGYGAFLQAYQVVLRYQAKFIMEKLNVPGFEPLLKELWQLFLKIQKTEDRIPLVEEDDTDNEETSASSTPMPPSSPTVMRNQQSAAYTEESDSSFSLDASTRGKEYKNVRYSMHRPLLVHSVALCYLTLIQLRVPITVHDLKVWIDSQEMPYMRAIRLIPSDMLTRLEPQYYEALDPQLRPTPSRLWKWTQQTAVFFMANTNITFPKVNFRPMIFTIVKDMLLPLDVYNAVDRQIHQLDLSLVPSQKVGMGRIPPECRVLCLVLTIAKLYYNLDGVQRTTKSSDEPLGRCPDIRAWQRIVRIQISALQGIDLASKTEPRDIFSMNDASLDDYMDWFSKTWTSKTNVQGLFTPEGILNMFEVSATTTGSAPKDDIEPSKNRLETIRWLYSLPYEKVLRSGSRPGSQYVTTFPDKPASKASLFDDLIELASLQNSIKNRELRRHVNQLEHRFAAQSERQCSQGKPNTRKKLPAVTNQAGSDHDHDQPGSMPDGGREPFGVEDGSDEDFEVGSENDDDDFNY